MKHLIRFLFAFFLSGIIFISCQNQSNPIEAIDDNEPVLMKPANAGAEIFRYSAENVFTFFDWEAGLRLRVGANSDQWCADGYPILDEFDFKDIILPNSDPEVFDRVIQKIKGNDVYAEVRAWPHEYPDNCSYYAAVPAIATGTVKLIATDNDVYAYLQGGNNTNAFGYKANGKLTGPEGQTYNLNFVFRAHWDGVDLASYKEVIKIKLTPVGGK